MKKEVIMEMTELRLGNWVVYNNQIVKTTGLHYGMFECGCPDGNNWMCTGRISEVHPIELTEEILLKIGFEHHAVDRNIYAFENERSIVVYILNRKLLIIEGVENDVLIDRNIRINNVEYLHQLQNVYYLLIGKELEVSL